jgi:ribosomal protein S18 acetylase RimI-like enzyme
VGLTVPSQARIRTGSPKDLDELLRLESAGFKLDRFSKKQFQYLLSRANSTTYILEDGNIVKGAAIMLWKKSPSIGRLYSIVIDPAHQGQGLSTKLMDACEKGAIEMNCDRIVLEVRADNKPAIKLYEKYGFRPFRTIPGYYSDGINGLQMIKRLEYSGKPEILLDIPYYAQTLDFTCGTASLMMAMKFFKPSLEMTRTLELMLWKESTLIFMSAGFGGCSPVGLAAAAGRRGFKVKIMMGSRRTPFLSSVRSQEKKEVVKIVHEALKQEAKQVGVVEEYRNFNFPDIAEALRRGSVPIVLISTYRLHKDRSPHYVVVTGFDRQHVYYHDPYEQFFEHDRKKARHVRIPVSQFHLVRKYGKDINKNVIFIEGLVTSSKKQPDRK